MAELAISCDRIWKRYRLYHHRPTLKRRLAGDRSRYEVLWALRGVDLEVPSGSSWGIVGPNGAGKTTLLTVIAGVLRPDRGTVCVSGSIAALIQLGLGFHPELTGRENVYIGGALLGRTKRDIDSRYDSIVEFAGLERFIDVPVKSYSSGMYARLGFALATSVEADILLIDEVLAVGDETFRARSRDRLAELWAEGRTVILVSHSLETISTMCSSAAWIDEGVIRMTGDSGEVTRAYARDAAVTQAGNAQNAIRAHRGVS